MDIHAKFVDMDGKFHIHDNPACAKDCGIRDQYMGQLLEDFAYTRSIEYTELTVHAQEKVHR